MDDDLFTNQQAAEMLGISERQVRRRAANGKIERETSGGRTYYRISEMLIKSELPR